MKRVICLFFILWFGNAFGVEPLRYGIRFRDISLEEALKASKKENKPVFMHGYASWCHFCIYMTDSVYPDSLVGAFYNEHFISIKINLEKEGAELNKSLKSHTFPTMVFFDAKGEVVHRGAGRRHRSMFVELGKEAIDPRRQLRTWLNVYNNGNVRADTAYQVIRKMEIAGMDTQEALLKYLNQLKPEEISTRANWQIIKECYKDVDAPFMNTLLSRKQELEKLYTSKEVNDKILAIYDFEFYMLNRTLDSAGYDTLQKNVKATKFDIGNMICDHADLNRFKAASQYANYFKAAALFVKNYCDSNAALLYEVAHVVYEKITDVSQLSKASMWMQRAVVLDDSFKNNILLCGLLIQQGEKKQAKIVAEHALRIAEEKKLNNRTLLLMMDRIEQMQ